jgi:predicted RNA-binding Zn-ribbon protein involved in translation (DUF1610 family)
MALMDKLIGKRCAICHSKLDFGDKKGSAMGIGSGVKGFEAMISRMGHAAYKCRNCGVLICYTCAGKSKCPKCGKNVFDRALPQDA